MVTRMETMEGKRVIDELQQGKELANRLMNNLKRPSSDETNRSLISEILSSYDKAIFLLNSGRSSTGHTNGTVHRSPLVERFSDMDFKKRKISEKEPEKVKVCVGKGQDGACIEDGYCWRKYGQKEILGSKNPRGYYRCTHRFSQGCLAVKQVQRSDTDPSVFEVKYLGTHTCDVIPVAAAAATDHAPVRRPEQKPHDTEQIDGMNSKQPTKPEDILLNLDDLVGNQVDNIHLPFHFNQREIFRTFSFSKVEPENAEWKSGNVFLGTMVENLSPATPGSVITTSELMSSSTSVTNSPTGDSYLSSLDNIIDFDVDFSLDSFLELLS